MSRGRGYDDWYYHAPPVRPADGIKAITQRGKFGQTWWSGRWIAALERIVDPGRLSRGRSYARKGQVVRLDVDAAGVRAAVQGSYPHPYDVSIRFAHLTDVQWDAAIAAMAERALFAARLLSGEMPEQIEEAFAAAGTALFPADKRDLMTECSCPDWSNPCKHVAAVHYLLGERFEADPFLLFLLRGRSRDAVLTALRDRRSAGGSADDLPAAGVEEPVPDPEPLPSAAGAFWSSPGPMPETALSYEPPSVDALLVKVRDAPRFWQERTPFAEAMADLYRTIGSHARDLVNGEPEPVPPARAARGRRKT